MLRSPLIALCAGLFGFLPAMASAKDYSAMHLDWSKTKSYVSPVSEVEQQMHEPEALDPMVFSVAEDCRKKKCELVALGEGDVVLDAYKALEELASDYPQVSRVFLHSRGGNLQGGLRLGLTMRDRGMDTAISPHMRCVSACAYAFLGGVRRELMSGGILGVHRFRAAGGTAGVDEAQQISALLVTYVEGLGLSRDILDLSARAGSNEVVGLTRSQAKELGVDNTTGELLDWTLKAADGGQLIMGSGGRSWGSDRHMSAAVVIKEDLAVVNVRLLDPPLHSDTRQAAELRNFSLLLCPTTDEALIKERCVYAKPAEAPEANENGELALFFVVPASKFMALSSTGPSFESVAFVIYGGEEGDAPVGMLRTGAKSFDNSLQALRRSL